MPSPRDKPLQKKPRLCMFGDSHLAAAKLACEAGHPLTDHFDIQFWGAAGPQFRELDFVGGEYVCRTTEAADAVKSISGDGSDRLVASEYDHFVFYGGRFRISELMIPFLEIRLDHEGAVSEAVFLTATRRFINNCRSVRAAFQIAASDSSEVAFLPTAHPARANGDTSVEHCLHATEADRAWVIDRCRAEFEKNGVILVDQPPQTFSDGVYTDPKYLRDSDETPSDLVHMSPHFAALHLDRLLIKLNLA